MAQWYEISPYTLSATPVRVVGATAKTVQVLTYGGAVVRRPKESSFEEFCEGWPETQKRLLDLADMKLRRAKIALRDAEADMKRVREMKTPEPR